LSFIKFVYNKSTHSTTDPSSFNIVFGLNHLTPFYLIPLHIDKRVSLDGSRKAQVVKSLHESVWQHIQKNNEQFISKAKVVGILFLN